MRGPAMAGAALACLLAIGCAGSRAPAPLPVEPPDVATLPGVGDPLCDQAQGLAAAGEHKPAVDALAALADDGRECSESVLAAVELSRGLLEEADGLILGARAAQSAGDLAAARDALRRALDVYPKYYWAQKLLREVEVALAAGSSGLEDEARRLVAAGDSAAALELLGRAAALDPADGELQAQLEALRREVAREAVARARQAERDGDLEEADRRISEAMAAAPADPELSHEIVEYARLLGLQFFSAGELRRARDLWNRGLSLDPGNEKLLDYLGQVEDRLDSLDRIKVDEGGPG